MSVTRLNAAPVLRPQDTGTSLPDPPATTDTPFVTNLGLGLYLLFIISWFLQSGRRYPMLGAIRFDLLLVIAISILCLLSPPLRPAAGTATPRRWTSRRFVFILVGYAVLTLPLVEWPGSVLKAGLPEFFKAVVFCLFTGTLVRNKRGLTYLLMVFVGCQAFRVLEPLYLHVTEGYWGSFASMANWEFMNRLAGAPFDIINPNGLAFVIITTLAFCHFLCPLSKMGLLAYLAFLPLALWALTLTASRTGMLALILVLGGIWWKTRRKVLMLIVVAVTVFGVVPLLSDDLADRYESMFSSDTKNAGSVTDRTAGIKSGLIVATRRPLFGHGLGTSSEANANFGIEAQPTHNLYVEVAQELGFLGVPVFIGFIVTLARELMAARARCRAARATGLVSRLTDSLQIFLIMNIMFSLASYGLSGYEWYLMAGLSTVVTRLSLEATGADSMPVPAAIEAPSAIRRPFRGAYGPAGAAPVSGPRFNTRFRRHGIH
jgi:putative inorganic carbon (HCO3(-)) transporter